MASVFPGVPVTKLGPFDTLLSIERRGGYLATRRDILGGREWWCDPLSSMRADRPFSPIQRRQTFGRGDVIHGVALKNGSSSSTGHSTVASR